MQRQIITTKDNSKTLLIPSMNETYHSTHGALTEAEHIFINNGIKEFVNNEQPIYIFEMGFGTGLNAILTYKFAQKHHLKINYHTIEKYPITEKELNLLNYSQLLNLNETETSVLKQMHQSYLYELSLSYDFNFKLIIDDFKKINMESNKFDLIYFDAFAPSHQPNLWTKEILLKLYDSLKPNGFLITYCAQGQFKRNLKHLGFDVLKLAGPPGKREITKAIKI